ncbi:MAG: hypothetical protein K2O13_00745 [Lachnospiraceae bacterium]|nr:hypothetical protein [Lachnospiraceae bacterium]
MAAINFNAVFFNHEIPFCKVYGTESKDRLIKLLVMNRISFFIEWPERRFWDERNVFTIRINEADSMLAKNLVEGWDCVKLRAV